MTPEHEAKLLAAKAALAESMKAWCDEYELTGPDALALCAYMTGIAIANQDQRKMTSEMAMDLVMKNITAGNKAAMEELLSAGAKGQANA